MSGFGAQQQGKFCLWTWLYQQTECEKVSWLSTPATWMKLILTCHQRFLCPGFFFRRYPPISCSSEKKKSNNNNKPNRRLNSPLSLPVFGWVAYRSPLQNKIARKSPTIIPTKISRSFMNGSHDISALVRSKKVYFFNDDWPRAPMKIALATDVISTEVLSRNASLEKGSDISKYLKMPSKYRFFLVLKLE